MDTCPVCVMHWFCVLEKLSDSVAFRFKNLTLKKKLIKTQVSAFVTNGKGSFKYYITPFGGWVGSSFVTMCYKGGWVGKRFRYVTKSIIYVQRRTSLLNNVPALWSTQFPAPVTDEGSLNNQTSIEPTVQEQQNNL